MNNPARSRRPKDEVKHEAILKAATKLFLKNGYSNTSMDAIAAAARVTKQTVYAHYKSKDALFTHMVSNLCDRHTPSGQLLEKENKPVENSLYEIGLGFLNMITSAEGLAATRLVIAEVAKHPKLAQRYYEDGTQRMVTMLAQFLNLQNKRGRLAIPDTKSAASYFFAMLKGQYHIRMILAIRPAPQPRDKEAHVRETVTIFLRIYGGSKPMATSSTL
jgi:TetR/AcrR family transcriptional repressor of mexJK operon